MKIDDYRAGLIRPDFDAIEASALHTMGEYWCAWRLEPRGEGKPAKVPYRAASVKLSTSRPNEWLSYDQAKALYKNGGFDGIGFLPMFEDGTVGLDLDGVISPVDSAVGDSGRQYVEWLEAVGCYIEISPSGNGLRAFVKGIRDGITKTTSGGHSIEAYQADPNWQDGPPAVQPHYVSVTGFFWMGAALPLDPPGAQEKLEKFLLMTGLLGPGPGEAEGEDIVEGFDGWQRRSDEEVQRLLLGSYNQRGKINHAWSGDTTDYGGESEARAALIWQLWYLSRDAAQIRRLVLKSGLDQRRFAEKRNGYADFLDYEICRAGLRQKRNLDHDRAQKSAVSERAKAGAKVLDAKAKEVTGGTGLEDLKNHQGKFPASLHVATELLVRDGRLAGVVYLDTFANDIRKSVSLAESFKDRSAPRDRGQWCNADDYAVEAWLYREWGLILPNGMVRAAAYRWAAATAFNPVAARLQELRDTWDQKPRLDTLFADYFRAAADNDDKRLYLAEVGKRFFIGVVARALRPGTKQDQMLVIEGGQGGHKTMAIEVLASAVADDVMLKGFNLSHDKDCLLQLRGMLLGEWDELQGFGKRESESVKSFLSRPFDQYRDPYGSRVMKHQRTISFIGSTNEDEYLRDTTGNRRYWPVKVGRIDIAGLTKDAPMLWGEAVNLYESGARHWIDLDKDAALNIACRKEQNRRMVRGLLDDIASGLSGMEAFGMLVDEDGHKHMPGWRYSSKWLYSKFMPADSIGRSEEMAIATALKGAGWLKRESNGQSLWSLPIEVINELRSRDEVPLVSEVSRDKKGLRK